MTPSSRRARPTALVALGALVALAACAPAASTPRGAGAASSGRPYVVLVSLDGFRHDYLDRHHPAALERLAARGVVAEGLIPPFPSKTFPSHYSIATGFHPGHHGVVANVFYDPDRGRWFNIKDSTASRDGRWYGGVPIWVAAEREGVRSSVYFWPGSEGKVQGTRPSAWWRYRAATPDSVRVDESLAQLRLPPARRPHLVMLYFSEVDEITHRLGPESPGTALAVATVDRAVSRLLEGIDRLPIRDSVNVVVVSDHGMAETRRHRVLPLRPMLAAAGIDTLAVRMGDDGPTMSLWLGDSALARRTLAALSAGLVHARAYARGVTPARWHLDGNARGGDVIVVAEPGWLIVQGEHDRAPALGAHGWDPNDDPSMQGLFVAAGPQIARAGRIPAFENVHLYPFLVALLRLERAPRTDGDPAVLAPYLRAAP